MSTGDWEYVKNFARGEGVSLSGAGIKRTTTFGHALDQVMAASGNYPMGGAK